MSSERYLTSSILRLAALLLPLFADAAALPAQQTKPLDPANLDTTCSPCQDFYSYANGGWLARTTIPSDLASWGSFNELQEKNFTALHQILNQARAEAPTTRDADLRKLGQFYGTCMDSAAIERAGIEPLAPDLARIAAIRDRSGIQAELARLHLAGVPAGFRLRSVPDAKNSARTIAELFQGGLGLPDRDYYTREDSASQALRRQYAEHVERMFRLAGEDSLAASAAGRAVLALENALARASMMRQQLREPESLYHLTRLPALERAAPAFDWRGYAAALKLGNLAELNVGQPRFVAAFDSLFARGPVEDWRAYLRWKLLSATAPALSTPFVNESFRFNGTVLQGVKEMRPRWKRCLERSDNAVGEILGRAYVKRHFSPEAKSRALEMVQHIRAEFRKRLARVSWMSRATKVKAYAKLDAIVEKIGYPDRWRDYSALEVGSGPFVLNQLAANRFAVRRDLAKIGRPTDRTEWLMSPPTVNAYYNPPTNEIAFPAGILQPPFFDPQADDAVNYGGMGAVIGHEITHGFDDQGRQFDAQGNLSGWWTKEDAREFNRRAEVVRRQFDGYIAIDSLRVNGKLTLGENIADLGGLLIAYGAYQRSLRGRPTPAPIDGLTADQRFLLAWAQIWRSLRRPELARMLVTVDPHAPPMYRTNGPLSNILAFAAAFGCKPGDPMVRSERAEIW